MADIKKINIKDIYKKAEYNILFYNSFKSTRSGFKHITELYINDYYMGSFTCSYINRTWEYYTYQSVMSKAINNIKSEIKDRIIAEYKEVNNISRITEKTKKDLEVYINNNRQYKIYNIIDEIIEKNSRSTIDVKLYKNKYKLI